MTVDDEHGDVLDPASQLQLEHGARRGEAHEAVARRAYAGALLFRLRSGPLVVSFMAIGAGVILTAVSIPAIVTATSLSRGERFGLMALLVATQVLLALVVAVGVRWALRALDPPTSDSGVPSN